MPATAAILIICRPQSLAGHPSTMRQYRISGWGLYPIAKAYKSKARYPQDLVCLARQQKPLLPQGNCRSYGDACLFDRVVSTLSLNHLLGFDPERGILRAEAGITLDAIIRFALPRGWFLPVTPGTKFPTLGGCIAADVHGKNHHVDGSISSFVVELEMVLANGSQVRCSPRENSDLFRATLGGMGLTGFIYAVVLRLRQVSSAYIRMHSIKTASLAETCSILEETREGYQYSVAWVDCLARGRQSGRGLVILGNHVPADALGSSTPLRLHPASKRNLPFHLPRPAINRWSVRVFNAFYYHKQLRRCKDSLVHYDPFFYPLDAIGHWNRIYGRCGFLQYQFVVPFTNSGKIIKEIMQYLATWDAASSLAVLKALGPRKGGLLSFPMPGYTMALDFPVGDGSIIPRLHDLDKMVLQAGGRIYLAKDAILERPSFEAMYPGLGEFKRIKRRYDPDNLFRSHQSERLGIS